jgi:ATP-dependent helicase/nuclease subunit B
MAERARRPAIFTIPSNQAFADSLVAGLIERFGDNPLELASGRILLPNNRSLRTITDAFVRLSGGGLLLPRLIAVGDPALGERIGGALEPVDDMEPPPAIEPFERLLYLASIVRGTVGGSAEALRMAADLAQTIDSLGVEMVDSRRLKEVVDEREPGARHWQKSLAQLSAMLNDWPALLAERGAIDLVDRRNRLLANLERRWRTEPPAGFTIAAGITTAAPAIAALLRRIAEMPNGEVVLPGLWLEDILPEEEWIALGLEEGCADEPAHPQYHLKQLLHRMGMTRDDVRPWRWEAGAASPRSRAVAIAKTMAAPQFSHKWLSLKPAQRRFDGIRLAEFPDLASEAQGIALRMREALETPGKTAALVTPDRALAGRVSALLGRWGITADDSAGATLTSLPVGSFLLALATLAAEAFAPLALLAVLKHPLAGGEGEERRKWLDSVRVVDLHLRGPRPPAGLEGLDRRLNEGDAASAWAALRVKVATLDGLFAVDLGLPEFTERLAAVATELSQGAVWKGPAGRLAAEVIAEVGRGGRASALIVKPADAVPILRQILDGQMVRPPFGGHPRLFIWGLLEARLQHADLTILGGLNEGSWPPLPAPDPFLPPRIRADLEMPTLETRIGLTAQDFAHACGAPQVLITRAKRDGRAPTVASRFWLRLKAINPDIAIDHELPALAGALDDPGPANPVGRPAPIPDPARRPKAISVTRADLLRADPYAFYARKILRLEPLDPVDADASAAWRGVSIHSAFQRWLEEDSCAPDKLAGRIDEMLDDPEVHPLARTLWRARIEAAADWTAEQVAADRANDREPQKAEKEGSIDFAGVRLHGTADRLDRLASGATAIVDYKSGHAPDKKAIVAGFRLQLGYLGLIAQGGGFGPEFANPQAFEYWSLARSRNSKSRDFGYVQSSAPEGPEALIGQARTVFRQLAEKYLLGTAPFTAKAEPEYAYGSDYDQLMRLEEWYSRL